jgi:uncharacterized protein YdeI (BOF family)
LAFQPQLLLQPHRLAAVLRTALLLLALGAALWGGTHAFWLLRYPDLRIAVGDEVALSNLTLAVDQMNWVDHQHDPNEDANSVTLLPADPNYTPPPVDTTASTGFAMPRAMMPGIPAEGQQRLRVELTLHNTGTGLKEIKPADFMVEDANGKVFVPLANSTFRSQKLTPDQRIGAILFIDVDEDAKSPLLIWRHDGAQVTLAITDVPVHEAPH